MEQKENAHPLDLSYLVAMVGEDKQSLLEVFDTFILRTPFYISALEMAINEGDWGKAADAAHKIKPVFAYIGRKDLSEFIRTIEVEVIDKPSHKHLSAKINHLKQQVDEVFEQLKILKIELGA